MLQSFQNEIIGRLASIVAQIAAQNGLSQTIATTDHLVDSGMTSMAMVDLMLAVEAAFDVTIPQREMTPSNFQSIASLAQMLVRIGKVAMPGGSEPASPDLRSEPRRAVPA